MTFTILSCLLLAAMGAVAEDSTVAGRFVVEHPTLLSLGFEWQIGGDANRKATIAVEFRAVGEPGWRPALPLVRIGAESVYRRREYLDYTVPDGFAGSILNLQAGTEYECRLRLTDPDGASGQTEHTVGVRTRVEPQPLEGEAYAARLPRGLSGPATGAQLHELVAGLLRRRPGRLERRLGTASPAGRYDPEQEVGEPSSNMHFRNNLFLGRDTPGRGIMSWANATSAFSSDYDGFRPNRGVAEQYTWLAPGAGQRLYEPGPGDWRSFATLTDFRAATTGQELHGLEVDFDDFERLVLLTRPTGMRSITPWIWTSGSSRRAGRWMRSSGSRR
jgi:hypothetical protein